MAREKKEIGILVLINNKKDNVSKRDIKALERFLKTMPDKFNWAIIDCKRVVGKFN